MIIGIIPNKNDGWILEANLKIFSKLCDKIIVGQDNCTDGSENILKNLSNVITIKNPNSDLAVNQKNRRQILLDKARELSENPIIIAIDADEIFSEQILNRKNIEIINNLVPNTTLKVRFRELWFSPYLYRSESKSSWAGRLMPCIWRDCGKDYPFNNWHEVRVPEQLNSKILDVDLIHFARVLPLNYWSRIRYYIARDIYKNKKNDVKSNFHYSITHSEKNMILSPTKEEWFPSLKQEILNIEKKDSFINWYNDEVLGFLLNDKNSSLKLADIWDFDWIKYFQIRKNIEPDEETIYKLSDRRSDNEKKISYFIRMNYSYPKISIYFYINLLIIFLNKIKIYSFIRKFYFRLIKK